MPASPLWLTFKSRFQSKKQSASKLRLELRPSLSGDGRRSLSRGPLKRIDTPNTIAFVRSRSRESSTYKKNASKPRYRTHLRHQHHSVLPRAPPSKCQTPLRNSKSSSTASAQRAILPPELIYYILRLSSQTSSSPGLTLPRISAPSWPLSPFKLENQRRLNTLRSISLTCKSFRLWAVDQLLDHPIIYGSTNLNAFLRTCRKYQINVAQKVKHLTLDGWEVVALSSPSSTENLVDESDVPSSSIPTSLSRYTYRRGTLTSRLPLLMELCQNIRTLTVRGAIVFSLTDFDGSDHLEHLTLSHTILSDKTTTSRYHPFLLSLPNLTSLKLESTFFDKPTANHFLTNYTFPNLKKLEVASENAGEGGVGLIEDVKHATRSEVEIDTEGRIQGSSSSGNRIAGSISRSGWWDFDYVPAINRLNTNAGIAGHMGQQPVGGTGGVTEEGNLLSYVEEIMITSSGSGKSKTTHSTSTAVPILATQTGAVESLPFNLSPATSIQHLSIDVRHLSIALVQSIRKPLQTLCITENGKTTTEAVKLALGVLSQSLLDAQAYKAANKSDGLQINSLPNGNRIPITNRISAPRTGANRSQPGTPGMVTPNGTGGRTPNDGGSRTPTGFGMTLINGRSRAASFSIQLSQLLHHQSQSPVTLSIQQQQQQHFNVRQDQTFSTPTRNEEMEGEQVEVPEVRSGPVDDNGIEETSRNNALAGLHKLVIPLRWECEALLGGSREWNRLERGCVQAEISLELA